MNIITGDRQTGKTIKCIKRAAELTELWQCVYIVTPTYQRAQHIFSLAEKIGEDIRFPITYREILEGRYSGQNIDAFIFDDLLDFLPSLCPKVTIDTIVINEGLL